MKNQFPPNIATLNITSLQYIQVLHVPAKTMPHQFFNAYRGSQKLQEGNHVHPCHIYCKLNQTLLFSKFMHYFSNEIDVAEAVFCKNC